MADVRLFLFPYAGGTPAAFNNWPIEFPDSIETNIVYYPGRGSRFNEPPIRNFSVLVDEIHRAILPIVDKPFIFFGHSMGGTIAFELARQLKQRNLLQPQILFVSAQAAPQLPNPNPSIHTLPDSEFVNFLRGLNGIPADVINHSELMELLLPTLRADFETIENYEYVADKNQLTCPIIAFGGTDDPRVKPDHLEGWSIHTKASFKSYYFSGDHFFINTARRSVIASMVTEIKSLNATR
ncbi:MAG: thioesterase [Anaerolineales bacterium]|nr:thioesterase [Anaerolineales bacterium]